MIEFYPRIDNSSHGHDAYTAHREGDVVFVAVADGITSSDHPLEAAQTALRCALSAFVVEPRQQLDSFVRRLHETIEGAAANFSRGGSAETTLTVVIFHEQKPGIVDAMFAAAGDSPIYVAYPGPIMDVYPDTFLTMQIHGKPIQVENAGRVYSFIDCSAGRMKGRLVTGTFQMSSGELCILCTDGVPFNEHVLRDLRRGSGSHRFFNELVGGNLKNATDELFSRFQSAKALNDDATLVAVSVQTTEMMIQVPGAVHVDASEPATPPHAAHVGCEAGGQLHAETDDPDKSRTDHPGEHVGLHSRAIAAGDGGVPGFQSNEEGGEPEASPRDADAVSPPSLADERVSPDPVESSQMTSAKTSEQSTSPPGDRAHAG